MSDNSSHLIEVTQFYMQLQNVVFEWRRLRWRKIPETVDFKK